MTQTLALLLDVAHWRKGLRPDTSFRLAGVRLAPSPSRLLQSLGGRGHEEHNRYGSGGRAVGGLHGNGAVEQFTLTWQSA